MTEKDQAPHGGVCVGPRSEMAGRAAACQGCPNAAICASGRGAASGPDPDVKLIQQRMGKIRHKILVLSGKGGVGKSTLTKELAFTLGRRGFEVGLLDADICGPSLPRMTGVTDEEVHESANGWDAVSVDDNVSLISMHFLMQNKNDAVIYRGPRKNGMIKNFLMSVDWGQLDFLLVDTPPGTGDEHISLVTLLQQSQKEEPAKPSINAVVVTTPQEVAVADVRREVTFCRKTGLSVLGFVENMSGFVCPKCTGESDVFPSVRGEGAGQRLSDEFGAPLLGKVPLDVRLMQCCEKGEPLASVGGPAMAALDSVVSQILALLQEPKTKVGDEE